MKIGITGTREGMSLFQLDALTKMLDIINYNCRVNDIKPEFHHGDCKGVDEQGAKIAKELGYTIVSHPPESDYLRAYFESHESKAPAGYLQRDRNIVDECDLLIVVPLQMTWQPKGGTWYTHDYAKKINKPFNVIYPGVENEINAR